MQVGQTIKILIYSKHEDDPNLCTAERLVRHGLAERIRRYIEIPECSVVLNPFANTYIKSSDRVYVQTCGIVAIDVSWKRGIDTLKKIRRGNQRALPILIAANSINYGKPFKLSTAEALVAALIITGFHEEALEIASLFKWGQHFILLNRERIEKYLQAQSDEELEQIQRTIFNINTSSNTRILDLLHKYLLEEP
ncbi:MAG: DUF367 family protein [Ignisphaera sp.]